MFIAVQWSPFKKTGTADEGFAWEVKGHAKTYFPDILPP